MSFNLGDFFKRLEIGAYNYAAGEVEAEKAGLVQLVQSEIPAGEMTVQNVTAAITKRLGPIIGAMLQPEIAAITAEGGAALSQGIPGIVDRFAASLRAQAAKLSH